MIIRKIRFWLCALILAQAGFGCSTIKSWFPDKERDYQFRTEIPDLIIPDELKAHSLPNRMSGQVAAANSPATPVPSAVPVPGVKRLPETVVPSAPQEATAAVKQNQPDSQTSTDSVIVAAGNSAVSSLQVDQPQSQAWRLVARALSRQKIEIVERNIDKAYFYVKYDPDSIKPEDNSIWDEVAFLFGEDPSHEQEYRISLLETGQQTTEVTVQDSEGKTLSNRTATHLLKLITDGINLDLPTSMPDEGSKTSPVPEN